MTEFSLQELGAAGVIPVAGFLIVFNNAQGRKETLASVMFRGFDPEKNELSLTSLDDISRKVKGYRGIRQEFITKVGTTPIRALLAVLIQKRGSETRAWP
ncbi:MAG: hypothetical protein COT15_03405 [Candidatus Diapherotrites archaeon CG08_land_8_20_14_0_20_34_12]|nr:MAG: hypothetical protein COT15_03405 [Candidatus Diapherotrites archaeon CG08_land_8_20_14_0_20_34_12]